MRLLENFLSSSHEHGQQVVTNYPRLQVRLLESSLFERGLQEVTQPLPIPHEAGEEVLQHPHRVLLSRLVRVASSPLVITALILIRP